MITTMTPEEFETFKITPKLQAAEALNRILRGEISAVEAYDQILESVEGGPEEKRLKELRDFHQELVDYWSKEVSKKAIEFEDNSGPWGYVVKAFVGTAKLLGDSSSIRALEAGEDYGANEYKNFLENNYVSEKNKEYVRSVVMPKIDLNITSLRAMQKMQ